MIVGFRIYGVIDFASHKVTQFIWSCLSQRLSQFTTVDPHRYVYEIWLAYYMKLLKISVRKGPRSHKCMYLFQMSINHFIHLRSSVTLQDIRRASDAVRYNHPLRKHVNTVVSHCPEEFQDSLTKHLDDFQDYEDQRIQVSQETGFLRISLEILRMGRRRSGWYSNNAGWVKPGLT